jgi:phosphohistidine phosphatase
MVIGHNPGLETLLQLLSGQIESLPTAVIAHLALPVQHWTELTAETNGEIIDIWRPKELPDQSETEVEPEKGKKDKTKKKEKVTSRKKGK